MKWKDLRKHRPQCPAEFADHPRHHGMCDRYYELCRCRRLVGHRGPHRAPCYGKWR